MNVTFNNPIWALLFETTPILDYFDSETILLLKSTCKYFKKEIEEYLIYHKKTLTVKREKLRLFSSCKNLKYVELKSLDHDEDDADHTYSFNAFVKNNTGLKHLTCHLQEHFDISPLTRLEVLNCVRSKSSLESLKIQKNRNLRKIYCSDNRIKELILTPHVHLSVLECQHNNLSKLNLLQNESLETVRCSCNRLTSLELAANNKNLTFLDCESNLLRTLKVNSFDALITLRCGRNDLESLDVSNCTALENLYCSWSPNLKNLYLPRNLETLECNSCNIQSLNLEEITRLEILHCYNNKLESLKVTSDQLEWLDCSENKITVLELNEKCSDTLHVVCYSENPSLVCSIDLSKCKYRYLM